VPYTLVMGSVWVVAGVVLGNVIGILLRSVAARRQVARARAATGDQAELERLRGRVANLESVVAERDRLRSELDALTAAAGAPSGVVDPGSARHDAAVEPDESAPSTPDVVAAAERLGRPVVLDDLTVVEGLNDSVQELCHGIGIRTWWDLGRTEVSLLRTLLDDAGARFHVYDPSTWPEQARLLAAGRWDEFAELTAAARATRASE
jgi:predicted flap endonuclease-1-like 5' DNA nuclease